MLWHSRICSGRYAILLWGSRTLKIRSTSSWAFSWVYFFMDHSVLLSFFVFPSYSHSPPRWVREQCGQAPGQGLTGIFPGSLLLSIPEQRRLSYAQAVLGVSLYEPSHLLPGLPGPAAGGIARRPLGPGPGALWGGYGCVLPALLVCTFQGAAKGEVFPPSAVLPKKGLSEYPHAADFSKYFFRSFRIRSLRLMTARWVTPIRRAYSLVERRS